MDFDSQENVKADGMKRNSRLRNLALSIEVVVCVVLMLLLSWSTLSLRIPVVGELSDFKFSTHSVFIIGNLIIVVVVVQSGKMAGTSSGQKAELGRDDQRVSDSRRGAGFVLNAKKFSGVEFAEEKKSSDDVDESRETQLSFDQTVVEPMKNVADVIPESSQLYRRTLSASYERGIRPELRRSKTAKWGGGGGGGSGASGSVPGTFDDLSHEEFRRKIETFISNQQRLIREESVVVGDGRIRMS